MGTPNPWKLKSWSVCGLSRHLADKPVQAPYLAQVGGVLRRCRIRLDHATFTARPYLRNKIFLQRNCVGNFVRKVKKNDGLIYLQNENSLAQKFLLWTKILYWSGVLHQMTVMGRCACVDLWTLICWTASVKNTSTTYQIRRLKVNFACSLLVASPCYQTHLR